MPEWDAYACEIPKSSGASVKLCNTLTEVHHVVHMSEARRILEDDQIRAGLIYDESRLNRSRLCVAWLSANTWSNGSIYGNIQFSFDWLDIIKERHFYWVEAMTEYNPHAYRLLITERNLKPGLIKSYDPAADDGPLKCNGSTWYWNDEFTSEFMVEANLPLSLCKKISFIQHNKTICRDKSCQDMKASPRDTGGRVMAFILGNAIDCTNEALLPDDAESYPDRLSSSGEAGVIGVWRALGRKAEHFTGIIKKPISRRALMRGALALYGSDQIKAAKNLTALLASQEIFEKALSEVVSKHFGFDSYQIPD